MKKDEIGYWVCVGIIAWWIAVFGTGCASVVSGLSDGHPNRKVLAVPTRSTVTMLAGGEYKAGYEGIIVIPRGAGAFRANSGRIEKDGYMIAVVQRRLNWWLLGNVLYGGPVGLVVDFVGGGAYSPKVAYLANPESTK